MALQKNPGPLLTSKFRGLLDVIPQKWRSKLGLTRTVQEQPVDVDPTPIGDTTATGVRISSTVEQERTDERKKTDVFITDVLGAVMVEYVRTPDGQIATRTHTVVAEGTPLPTIDELTADASQEAWGNGQVEQVVTTVPNLFGKNDYKVERPDRVPPDFGALLKTTETGVTVAGTAAMPVLGVGELMRSEQQITEQTKRVTVRFRDLASLPIILTSYDTDQDKEIVTVVRTWQLATVPPIPPTATTDTKLEPLGDGTAIQTVASKDVFDHPVYSVERADRVPEDFGALLQVTETSTIVTGAATPPVLGTGELMRREEQITEFTKRVTVRARDVSVLPKTLVNKRTNDDKQVVTVTRTWDVDAMTVPLPSALQDVTFTRLGDGTAILEVPGVPNVFGGRDYTRQRPDNVPPEFGSLLEVTEFSESVTGTAANPTLGTGELSREEKQLSEFVKRVTVRARDVASLPMSLVDKDTDENKQVVTVTKTWQLDTVVPPAPTSLTKIKLNKLGDGTAIQIVLGVPNVFGGLDYSREIRDLVPPEFSALVETTVFTQDIAGTAADPVLGVGELAREEKQLDEFVKRVTVKARDVAILPKTLINYDTDQNKEIVTVTRTWQLDTVTPLVPTATKDTNFEKLGDGTAIQTTKEKAVFPGQVYGKNLENLIPPKFRAFIPTRVHEVTTTGVVVPDPAFATGEISHEEQQIDEFNKRTKSVTIAAPSLPVVGHDYETGEEYGGGVLNITYTLNTTGVIGSSVDTGLGVVESKITDLGNGYSIKETKQKSVLPWPLLQGQDYDERLDVVLPFTQQVVAAGTGIGTARTEIKPIDEWRQQSRTIDITEIQAVLDAYSLKYQGKVNIDMPDMLISVEGFMETTTGEGEQDESGTVAFTGQHSIQMSLRASAQSSATILPDVIMIVKQFWGSNINSTQIQFFLLSPVTPADVLTKLTAILGSAVSAWPKFNPEMITIKAVGQRTSLQVVATSQGSESSGGSGGSSSTAAGGTGQSREVGLSLKTVRISPTIHAAITLTGTLTSSSTISATATAEATGLGPFETIVESATVNASITPTTIPATTGATAWPTTGKYLLRVDAQPYRFGYIQYHCVVVDAVDFPTT